MSFLRIRHSRHPQRRHPEEAFQYREAIAGSIIAVIIEAANYLFLGSSEGGTQLALTVAIFGVLLALLRAAIQGSLHAALEPVRKQADVLDLQTDSNVAAIHGLLQRYLSINEPEFRPLKEQVLSEAAEQLRRLAVEKRSTTLRTTDYYDWLFRQFDALHKDQYMHAVSLSSDTEWNDSQLERNFLKKNLEAASRKANIVRIFIVEDERLEAFLKLPPVDAHTLEVKNGLQAFLVSKNYLQKVDRECLAAVGEGFIDFNGHVGLEDRFDPDGQARGEVTMLKADLDTMKRVYERLLNMAEPLSRALTKGEQKTWPTLKGVV